MKAYELFEEIIKGGETPAWKTCDVLKAGDPNKELNKVAVTMFATVETVKKAKGLDCPTSQTTETFSKIF